MEYRLAKHRGTAKENQGIDRWVDHMYPDNARVSRNSVGIEFQIGRLIFALDDGRLGELHLPGIGGESVGPTRPPSARRKSSLKYVWSVLDAPETEGWNSQYCTEERGPLNCIEGTSDESIDMGITIASSRTRRGSKSQQTYLILLPTNVRNRNIPMEELNVPENWIQTCFRLRLMVGGRSFFMITETGLTIEYINVENVWFWLIHDHLTAIKGAVGNYNGSLFVVDEHGSLLMRERESNELGWLNCTSLRKGKFIIGGPPWDELPGNYQKVSQKDGELFFVSKTGRLLQFTVAMRKYKWKDCRNPPNTKVAGIVDQEIFRYGIVFVVGKNGRLYQYNKITENWHEHYQSQHLVLSRQPGTALRQLSSLSGSLFMISEDGGLVEYHWNALEGWNWVEHGTPYKGVYMVGSPGPSFQLKQLFLIGSDGNVYLRYMDKTTWKWKNCDHPHDKICIDDEFLSTHMKIEVDCDPKIAPTRPIPLSEHSVIFQLRDGRLGEMERKEEGWVWMRTIGTPTSTCMTTSWTDLASSN
ncbi:uncharacterized protein LOC124911496 [Impatiens glandulifera]|uniref:uncharacterized protein LOC124911496 n=1 Tax=Impatiens glandulifera TaxID=253017 RepID=UPI001FB15E83|nr:uncharacterized protein LOC124911496 [Impatiens glandulifera]